MPEETRRIDLNAVGVLVRREIEARIIAPLVEAFSQELGREKTLAIAAEVIKGLAREQARQLAAKAGGNGIAEFVNTTGAWTKANALETQVLERTDTTYPFNVTRCRYAEMYRRLGIPELGAVISCNRDYVFGEGFNPDLKLTRTQTIMESATHCDFRYRLETSRPKAPGGPRPSSGSTRRAR